MQISGVLDKISELHHSSRKVRKHRQKKFGLAEEINALTAPHKAGVVVNNPSLPVSFPTDFSRESRLARLQTAILTLQSLNGPGIGCPLASTTFIAQRNEI
jgi:hypothetical protein